MRVAVYEARERATGEGKKIGRSRQKCNGVQVVGEQCGNNKAGVKQYAFHKNVIVVFR